MPETLLADRVVSTDPATGRKPLLPRPAAPFVDRVLGLRTTTVRAVRAETATVHVLQLEPPVDFDHAAGQYLFLRLDTEDGPDMRPLSIASPPWASTVELATRSGLSSFKRAIARLEPGTAVGISRPRGRFRLDQAHPAVIVTGGIGIAPIRSMLHDALEQGYEHPIRLLYANRDPDEIAYQDDLRRLSVAYPSLEVTWIVSSRGERSSPTGMHVGRIDSDVLAPHLAALPDARFYLTGPSPMVAGIRQVLRHAGVPRRRVHLSEQTLPIDRFTHRSY